MFERASGWRFWTLWARCEGEEEAGRARASSPGAATARPAQRPITPRGGPAEDRLLRRRQRRRRVGRPRADAPSVLSRGLRRRGGRGRALFALRKFLCELATPKQATGGSMCGPVERDYDYRRSTCSPSSSCRRSTSSGRVRRRPQRGKSRPVPTAVGGRRRLRAPADCTTCSSPRPSESSGTASPPTTAACSALAQATGSSSPRSPWGAAGTATSRSSTLRATTTAPSATSPPRPTPSGTSRRRC